MSFNDGQSCWSASVDAPSWNRGDSRKRNSSGQLVLALSDKTLLYLVIDGGALVQKGKVQLEHEVRVQTSACWKPTGTPDSVACGFWQTRSFQIFSLPELTAVGQSFVVQQRFQAVPRSILLHRFASKQSRNVADSQSKRL